jgi:competence ComEA-like helix-hairpin-helix protein
MALPYFYSVNMGVPVVDPVLSALANHQKMTAAETDTTEAGKTPSDPAIKPPPVTAVLFDFDPNTISVEEWIRLGLKPATAQTIIKYRNKGGRFRKPDDIRRIWGLSKLLADRLLPYVKIGMQVPDFVDKVNHPAAVSYKKYDNEKIGSGCYIDINAATSNDWKILPGIGEVLANRIVQYRQKIGGFTDIEQVKKVYGIADSVFQRMRPFLQINPAQLKKLNLNTVMPIELSRRTGISAAVAKAIIVYRQQYGSFHSVADLQRIVFLNDSLIALILPHVVVE